MEGEWRSRRRRVALSGGQEADDASFFCCSIRVYLAEFFGVTGPEYSHIVRQPAEHRGTSPASVNAPVFEPDAVATLFLGFFSLLGPAASFRDFGFGSILPSQERQRAYLATFLRFFGICRTCPHWTHLSVFVLVRFRFSCLGLAFGSRFGGLPLSSRREFIGPPQARQRGRAAAFSSERETGRGSPQSEQTSCFPWFLVLNCICVHP